MAMSCYLSYCPAIHQTEIETDQTYSLSPGMSFTRLIACLALMESARRRIGSFFRDVQEILEMLFPRNLLCNFIIL